MSLLSAVQGVGYSLNLTEIKRLEDSVHAGRNAYMTAGLQIDQIASTVAIVEEAAKASAFSQATLPWWPGRIILYLTPVLLAYATKQGVQGQQQPGQQVAEPPANPEPWRPVVVFVQDHLTNLCHLVALVSSVVLIYFGSVAFGAASLALLTMGFLDRRGILPENIRQFIHEYSPPVATATGIFTGDIIVIAFSLLSAASYLAGRYLARQQVQREIPPVPNNAGNEMQRYLANPRLPLEVNRDHILWPTRANMVPDLDIATLVDQFDAIEWDEANIRVLRRKLGEDPRWKERCGDPALKNDQQLIAAARGQLAAAVRNVKGRCILNGEPRSYDDLVEYLKLIAHELPKKPEAEQIDALMKLAIEGGEYCGPGFIDESEMVYVAMVGECEFFTFQSKILHALQSERNRAAERAYSILTGIQPSELQPVGGAMRGFGKVIGGWQDRHYYHQAQNLYGEGLGLRKAGADNDAVAMIGPLEKLMVSHLVGDDIKELFWQRGYTLETIVETVKNAIGTSELPKPQAYDWWRERAEVDDYARLNGEPMEDQRNKFHDKFVRAMLLGMGILRIRG